MFFENNAPRTTTSRRGPFSIRYDVRQKYRLDGNLFGGIFDGFVNRKENRNPTVRADRELRTKTAGERRPVER